MQRGEIYWVDFPTPVGRRPAVLVSRDESYSVRSRCIVVPLTQTVRGIPTEIRLGPWRGVRGGFIPLDRGPREPAGAPPNVPFEKEVILVESKYSVQPGTGKRSLGRRQSRTSGSNCSRRRSHRAGLRQNNKAPPEA